MPDSDSYLDRRQFVAAVGATGTVAIAGCSGGGDGEGNGDSNGSDGSSGSDDTDTTGSGGSGEVLDRELHVPAPTDWSNVNWNIYNPQRDTEPQRNSWWVFDTVARFKQGEGEWEPIMAEDFRLEGDTVVIDLRDDYVWHNGDQLTSADLVTQYRLDKYVQTPLWDFAEEVSAPDDYTVEITVGEVNPNVLWPSFLDRRIFAKESEYGEFLDELESSDGSDEALNSLQSHEVTDPIGNGPFQVSETNSDSLVLERFPDYARADNINWSTVRATFYPEETGMQQAAIGDDLDAIDFRAFPENIIQQLPDHWELVRVPAFEGNMIAFSPDSDLVGLDVEYGRTLRRAIAHMFDAERYASLRTASTTISPMCGLANVSIDNYLGDTADDFTHYGPESKADQAAQMLRDAGFQKDGGQWYTPDDQLVELPVKYMASWTSVHTAFENVPEQLQDFGIASESVVEEDSTFFGPTVENQDFEIAITGNFGQAGFAYPYFNLQPNLGTVGEPIFWTHGQESYEVPMPVGDPNGDLQTINVNDKLNALAQEPDEEAAREIIHELAWTHNQVMPYMTPTEKRNQHFITRDEWSYPDSGSSILQTNVPHIFLPKTGRMQATE